ncbi:hypothetical protein F5884DRAFT_667380 [Xylogone sp. PMI_703]|nr:hypothetical protein F5884DRAFT_667380 [Xylogone sp. PMI_703]
MPDLILHNFQASPFGAKIRLILGLKRLPWKWAETELILPKPNLTALTGGYRKTPVLQIGADIYCDSRLIAMELEDRHPTPTLFPGGNRGLIMALCGWSDRELHLASSGLVLGFSKKQLPEDLMNDRRRFFDGVFDFDGLDADVPHLSAVLRAHVDFVDQQLSDGRSFLLGEEISLVDFHAYVEIWTARSFVPFVEQLFESFTHVAEWEKRVKEVGDGAYTMISATEAHEVARNSTPLPGKGVDPNDALKLAAGDKVVVTPDDYGREPVVGRLVTLTTHEVAVEREDPIVGTVVVHFPRIGFRIALTTS